MALATIGTLALVTMGIWQWEALRDRAIGITTALAAGDLSLPTGSSSPDGDSSHRASSYAADSSLPASSDAAGSRRTTALPQVPTQVPTQRPAQTLAQRPETPSGEPDELLHHRRYAEAPLAGLVPLNPKSDIRLQPIVQKTVNEMIARAKSEGVQLGVASGFRSIEDQNYLFFEVKAERGQSSKTRAEVSAPPGYSEHHTGYAVDFIDEGAPGTHTEKSFETTAAYRWLEKNAAFYSFELSFPDDPDSPLGYEPWHWRFVGDQKSLELFYKE